MIFQVQRSNRRKPCSVTYFPVSFSGLVRCTKIRVREEPSEIIGIVRVLWSAERESRSNLVHLHWRIGGPPAAGTPHARSSKTTHWAAPAVASQVGISSARGSASGTRMGSAAPFIVSTGDPAEVLEGIEAAFEEVAPGDRGWHRRCAGQAATGHEMEASHQMLRKRPEDPDGLTPYE